VTALARGFVAVVPPAPVLDALDRVLAPIRGVTPPRLAWARRAQWHLTLQFLGHVADVEAVAAALRQDLPSRPTLLLGLGGAGAFPSPGRAAVVWVGIDQGADDIGALAGAVGAVTAALGYEREERAFHAHVTVARARRPTPVGSLLAAIGDGPIGPAWDVGDVVLMESDTRPSGAVYREVAAFPLRG
jgi:2'-5' RNA ligase